MFQRSRALMHWCVEPRGKPSLFGPLADPGFVPLLAVIVCYASACGLVEIGTTAYATETGSPAFAGVLLGIMSIGSAAGGLVYGSRSWRLPLARQFPLMLAVMGLGIAPLAILASPWTFATSIDCMISAGVGLGLTLGGALLEYAKSPAVFAAAAVLSLAAGALALLLVKTRS